MIQLKESLILILLVCTMACKEEVKVLPVIGDRVDLQGNKEIHKIRDFAFVSQLGDTVTNADLAGKIYMTDFFFTSCPSICPKVKKQMLRIYKKGGRGLQVECRWIEI